MRQQMLLVLIIVSCVVLLMSVASCNNQKQQQQLKFYYYPKANVYYSINQNTYYYSVDGGRSWDSVAKLSDQEPVTLGNKETIYSTSTPVFQENEAHRKKYGGTLLNLVSTASTTASVDSGASERIIVKKSTRARATVRKSSEADKSQKKPLKDFFKKIFGKRKDR